MIRFSVVDHVYAHREIRHSLLVDFCVLDRFLCRTVRLRRPVPDPYVPYLNPPLQYKFRTALQASSRTFYAFSRDHGFPDKGIFGRMSKLTQTPLNAVWLNVFLSILPGLLDLASPVAASAIFSLTAVGMHLISRFLKERTDVMDWLISSGCLVHYSNSMQANLPQSSRSSLHTWPVLPGGRALGLGCQY